jgi:pimeloyl-ACP methyl ester carboxylesterase
MAMGLASAAAQGGGAPDNTDRCRDRLIPPAQSTSPAPARLPGLQYSCTPLRDGQHVLVGQAGVEHEDSVLLVHGLGNNAHRDWRATIAPLASRFHVVAVDLPGFGASQAPLGNYSFDALGETLAEVLERHAPGRRVHVVGHSLGGAASLHFAHRHPGRVERLVLVDAAGILHKSVFAQHLTRLQAPPTLGVEPVDRLLGSMGARVDALHRSVFNLVDDQFDFSRWLVETPSVRNALLGRYTQVDAALGLVEHDFTAAIREVHAPTTVIWGRDDPVAPLRTGELLAARMPDAQLHVIDGAQHVPMNEQRELFNSLLLQALTEAPARQAPAQTEPRAASGKVVCSGRTGARYSGAYESLVLENCHKVRIENASLGQLVLVRSSATVVNSVIDTPDGVALDARSSRLMATAVRISGRIALRAAASHLDLAGVSLHGSQRGIEMPTPSRIYFSVSDVTSAGRTKDAHYTWPVRPARE